MSRMYNIGGVAVKIEADPARLPAPNGTGSNATGDLVLSFENYSRIPARAQFNSANCVDHSVATVATVSRAKEINLPRRPSKYTARIPARGTEKFTTWKSVGRGVTTITVQLTITTKSAVLGSVLPDTEIEVF